MSTLAIIAEYNPYHNGHAYLLTKAKEITGADNAISVMSGNFVQRGEPALLNKYERAKLAVTEGIDLVVELPFCYATGSAYDFATGAIAMLSNLGNVDYLCFGVECEDESLLNDIAKLLVSETDEFKATLKAELSNGLSYPSARTKAILAHINSGYDDSTLKNILYSPNNILAIEYLCALKRLNSNIKPIMIKRIESEYHDSNLHSTISSATAIRNALETNANDIASSVSNHCYDLLISKNKIEAPAYAEDLTPFLQSLRLNNTSDYFSSICDFSEDMNNRMKDLPISLSFNELLANLSSKNWTETRIKRALLHSLLGYTTKDHDTFANQYAYYANILCFNKNKSVLLKEIKVHGTTCLITKKADFEKNINEHYNEHANASTIIQTANRMWQLDTTATLLYNCLVANRYQVTLPNDYSIQLPIITNLE